MIEEAKNFLKSDCLSGMKIVDCFPSLFIVLEVMPVTTISILLFRWTFGKGFDFMFLLELSDSRMCFC